MEKKYISVDQLWKCETCFYMGSNGECGSDCDAAVTYSPVYSKLEFADVAPVVHGRWEDKQNPQWKAYKIRHCSVCGWNIAKTKLRNKDSHWNYCPNCGAKMDGEKQDG